MRTERTLIVDNDYRSLRLVALIVVIASTMIMVAAGGITIADLIFLSVPYRAYLLLHTIGATIVVGFYLKYILAKKHNLLWKTLTVLAIFVLLSTIIAALRAEYVIRHSIFETTR